jgi:hypothetical protein
MQGPLRGILAGVAAWKLGWGLHFNHFDFYHRVLASRLRPMLATNKGEVFLLLIMGKDCLQVHAVEIRLQ